MPTSRKMRQNRKNRGEEIRGEARALTPNFVFAFSAPKISAGISTRAHAFILSDADEKGDVNVDGGEFTECRSSGNGGFLYVSDGAVANVTGGTVTRCVAGRRAGVVSDVGDACESSSGR